MFYDSVEIPQIFMVDDKNNAATHNLGNSQMILYSFLFFHLLLSHSYQARLLHLYFFFI
jgi:hypothetical protein